MEEFKEELEKIREKTVEILGTYFVDEALLELEKIDAIKRRSDFLQKSNEGQELLVYESLLGFVAFQALSEQKQIKLFETFLVKAFRVGLDVRGRFSLKMSLVESVLWPETSQLFVEAILRNEEKIGKSEIILSGETEKTQPTLANWLRDYNRVNGMDRHEKIVSHKYISENQNVSGLNSEEKFLLLKILDFYESIKFPSQAQVQSALDQVLDQYLAEAGEEANYFLQEDETEEENFIDQVNSEYAFMPNIKKDNLKNILQNYPRVSEQKIGEKPVKLTSTGESVPPTISNWLFDYKTYAGIGPHEVGERSDYLLRSPNVQDLAREDLDKLGLILRSYDENFNLPFSEENQAIIFQ